MTNRNKLQHFLDTGYKHVNDESFLYFRADGGGSIAIVLVKYNNIIAVIRKESVQVAAKSRYADQIRKFAQEHKLEVDDVNEYTLVCHLDKVCSRPNFRPTKPVGTFPQRIGSVREYWATEISPSISFTAPF